MINEEKSIKEKIISLIDQKKSFCFNAGAGSGKTHSLMETITYILNNNSKTLKKNNQKNKQKICLKSQIKKKK